MGPRLRGDDGGVLCERYNKNPPNKKAGVAAGFRLSLLTAQLVRGVERGFFLPGDGALDR
jgi:hypothetical protein